MRTGTMARPGRGQMELSWSKFTAASTSIGILCSRSGLLIVHHDGDGAPSSGRLRCGLCPNRRRACRFRATRCPRRPGRTSQPSTATCQEQPHKTRLRRAGAPAVRREQFCLVKLAHLLLLLVQNSDWRLMRRGTALHFAGREGRTEVCAFHVEQL